MSGILFREARIHPHELDFGEFDQQGNFLVMGGTEFGKIFLCDTQTTKSGIGKNHALKKYDQFAPNTSCFWEKYLITHYLSCAISRNFWYGEKNE